ncbi:hypothetical protein D3C87_1843150 [compost metagenome]
MHALSVPYHGINRQGKHITFASRWQEYIGLQPWLPLVSGVWNGSPDLCKLGARLQCRGDEANGHFLGLVFPAGNHNLNFLSLFYVFCFGRINISLNP